MPSAYIPVGHRYSTLFSSVVDHYHSKARDLLISKVPRREVHVFTGNETRAIASDAFFGKEIDGDEALANCRRYLDTIPPPAQVYRKSICVFVFVCVGILTPSRRSRRPCSAGLSKSTSARAHRRSTAKSGRPTISTS